MYNAYFVCFVRALNFNSELEETFGGILERNQALKQNQAVCLRYLKLLVLVDLLLCLLTEFCNL